MTVELLLQLHRFTLILLLIWPNYTKSQPAELWNQQYRSISSFRL